MTGKRKEKVREKTKKINTRKRKSSGARKVEEERWTKKVSKTGTRKKKWLEEKNKRRLTTSKISNSMKELRRAISK